MTINSMELVDVWISTV